MHAPAGETATAEVKVRRATSADWPALRAFYERCHPERKRLHDGATWNWAFCARAGSGAATFFVLETGAGAIVGGVGVRRFELRDGPGAIEAGLLVNYFVDDAFRGMPALRLLRAAQSAYAVLVGAYVTDSAYRLLTRAGFVDLGAAVRDYHLGVVPRGGLAGSARWLARAGARAGIALAAGLATRGVRYVVAERLDPALDDRFARPVGEVGVVKSADYLRWRYEGAPELACTFVHRYVGPELRGLAVLHAVGPRGLLLDLLCTDGRTLEYADLARAALRAARARGCATLETQCAGAGFDAALRAGLFGTSRGDLGLLVYAREPAARATLCDAARWHFTLGDSDAF